MEGLVVLIKNFSLLVIVLLLLSGCSSKRVDIPIYDLEHFSQDPETYADKNIVNKNMLLDIQKKYKKSYFKPWHYTKVPYTLKEIMWPYDSYTKGSRYGGNLVELEDNWFDKMLYRSNFNEYGKLKKYAITLNFTNLRNFPTSKPLFSDPSLAGEGYPFDYIQNSAVHANEPLYLSHYSKDGAWVYAFSSYATGWIELKDIAFVTSTQRKKYENFKHIFIIKENYPVKTLAGDFLLHSRVGMLLPIIATKKDYYIALAIEKRAKNRAIFTKVKIPKEVASSTVLKLNSENLASCATEMMKSEYGWGGVLKERDCSSTIRDMFVPFGIWLPRNSAQQAAVGKRLSIKDLTNSEKLEFIKNRAIPFETLLYKKGHILLYLGEYDGEVMVLQNVWGIKTFNDGVEGRKIIGRTVISTLKLGDRQDDFDEENSLLNTIESLNIITL